MEDFLGGIARAKEGHIWCYRWGCFDIQGNIIIPFEYDIIEDFVNGIARAKKNNRWAYIDNKGN